jgi:hypothetical protein
MEVGQAYEVIYGAVGWIVSEFQHVGVLVTLRVKSACTHMTFGV